MPTGIILIDTCHFPHTGEKVHLLILEGVVLYMVNHEGMLPLIVHHIILPLVLVSDIRIIGTRTNFVVEVQLDTVTSQALVEIIAILVASKDILLIVPIREQGIRNLQFVGNQQEN